MVAAAAVGEVAVAEIETEMEVADHLEVVGAAVEHLVVEVGAADLVETVIDKEDETIEEIGPIKYL